MSFALRCRIAAWKPSRSVQWSARRVRLNASAPTKTKWNKPAVVQRGFHSNESHRFASSTSKNALMFVFPFLAMATAAVVTFADEKNGEEKKASDETKDASADLPSEQQYHPKLATIIDEKSAKNMKIFSGTANIPLAKEIASELGVELGRISISRFADGEIGIQVLDNVRGKDVFIVQPTCPPGVNDHLMQLVLMVSTMRRASARKITAIIPYYGYARQDRKMQARVPISAADVARLLEAMGVDRVVAVDLHCGQIQGFFGPRTPCDNLEGAVVALNYFKGLGMVGSSTVVVSPDAGGVHRAKKFQDGLRRNGIDAGLAMIIKQRVRANAIASMDLVGNVKGLDVIIVDDMIDTAGTLTKAADELKQLGAKRVFAFATHGLFSGPAIERIARSELEQVVVCNTIPLQEHKKIDKIVQLSIAPLLAEAIARIQTKKSVSDLFNED